MRGGAVRLAGRCFGLTVATSMSAAVGAQQVQTGVLVSTGVSAESNPYNATSGPGGPALTAQVQPQLRYRTSENTSLDLNGLAQFRRFLHDYGLEDNYSANAFLNTRQSDRLTLRASASASYNEGGFNNYGRPGLSPLIGPLPSTGTTSIDATGATVVTPLPLPSVSDVALANQLPLLTDVNVLGLRTRTKSFGAGVGFSGVISAQSQLSGDLNLRGARFKSPLLSDYDNASAELRYSHTLNELSSVGLIGSVDRTNYRGTRVGDTTTKSALLSYDRRFARGWAVSVAAGLSSSDIRQLAGRPNVTLTALNVRGQFCNQAEYGRLCISGQRSPQPSANGAVSVSNSVAADYSRRLTERQSLSLTGTYTSTGRGRGSVLNLPSASFAAASAQFNNTLGERSSFYVNGTASKIFNGGASRDINLGIAAGISMRFGGLR